MQLYTFVLLFSRSSYHLFYALFTISRPRLCLAPAARSQLGHNIYAVFVCPFAAATDGAFPPAILSILLPADPHFHLQLVHGTALCLQLGWCEIMMPLRT